MKLWPHQARALSELDALIESGSKAICITCPTGGGKTRVMFDHLLRQGVPGIVYTDRKMLFSQLAEGLDEKGVVYGVRAAGHKPRLLEPIQLAMVQTEGSRVLKGNRDVHNAQRVYIDEAHKNSGDTMCQLMDQHINMSNLAGKECVVIGFTATPLGIDHFYDDLVVAGTNSELRECGALVPAYHYGPDEPDMKWVGKIAVGEGECGLQRNKRMEYAQRVFGRVVEHYEELNPDRKPTIGFGPDVASSIWLAQECCRNGIPSAHIDGQDVWVDGELIKKDQSAVDDVKKRCESGDIAIVWNRFVLREGINWPFVSHGIFATVFGSLTSYIQAGGRLLRAHPSKDSCTIQDHGGNWWRHGSLNEDREWKLEYTDRIVAGLREQRIRDREEREPIHCPKCDAIRMHGDTCLVCGYRHSGKSRRVLERDGSLREMRGDIFRRRRFLDPDEQVTAAWVKYVKNVRRSNKPTVKRLTFAQLEVNFAMDRNWKYPPRTLPMMPVHNTDWYRPASEVMELT